MKIFAVVGPSGSGKTRLACRLIGEFKRRGLSVAAMKHCHGGFLLDVEGKDSWRYAGAGADAVAMIAPEQTAVIWNSSHEDDIRSFAASHFAGMDIVFVEGGRSIRGLKKIEVLRPDVNPAVETAPEELLAVVAGGAVDTDKPVFRDSQIGALCDFLISL
ncbi:MAG: molybdopterin-guanine dinucleotide biosynthesis protein B [Acidobacteriota bacterium]|nr:molybdopterin-guanine dinucleotide biosynthesis protein B [Acidobacteriota bacterium]